MNYRHIFHAGNFADVFKHIILIRLLRAFHGKEKGFAFIETHAGAGRYDLQEPNAGKTGEYRDGIDRLWAESTGLPGSIEEYLDIVRALNVGGELRYYPGSPLIARFQLRPQDRMRLVEKSVKECAALGAEFAQDVRVSIHCGDGYAALKRWVPPPERRGLVFIDPPYETDEEWEQLRDTLTNVAKRWREGVCAVWYPLKAGAPVERFKATLEKSGLRKILMTEINVWPPDSPFRLNGCGMIILNPPWQLDTELPALLDPLVNRLRQSPEAQVRVEWLVPE